MSVFLRYHWAAIILAFLVGGIYLSHHILVPLFLAPADGLYYPITPQTYYDESLFYAQRSHAVFVNGGLNGDFSLAEGKEGPAPFSVLGPAILGGLSALVGNFARGVAVSDFLMPLIIFLMVYAIALSITGRRPASIMFAVFFIFIPKLGIYLPPVNYSHFQGLMDGFLPYLHPANLHFSEFDEPKFTFPFLALFVFLTLRAVRRGGWSNIILAGLSYGLIFYSYFYDWATASAALGLAVGIMFFMGDREGAKRGVLVIAVGLLVSAYFWFNIFSLRFIAPDLVARIGGEAGRYFRWITVWKSYLRIGALISGLWLVLRANDRRLFALLAGLLGAYLAVVNAQLITGFNPQPDHWYRFEFLPVALAVFVILFFLYKRWAPVLVSRAIPALAAVLVIYIFSSNVYAQYLLSSREAKTFAVAPDVAAVYKYLNNAPKESIVGALPPNANTDIQLHTPLKIFLPFGLSTLATDDELWTRSMILARLFGFTPTEYRKFIREQATYYLFVEEYGDRSFDATFGNYERIMPENILDEKVKAYGDFLKRPLGNLPYRLDYLYVDSRDGTLAPVPASGEYKFEEIYHSPEARLYRVIPANFK